MPAASGRSRATASSETAAGKKKARQSFTADPRLLDSDSDSDSQQAEQRGPKPSAARKTTASKAAGSSKASSQPKPASKATSKAAGSTQVSPGSRRSTRLSGEGAQAGGSDEEQSQARPPKKSTKLVPSKRKQPPAPAAPPGTSQPTPPLTDPEDDAAHLAEASSRSQGSNRSGKGAQTSAISQGKKARVDNSQRTSPSRKAQVRQIPSAAFKKCH